MRALAGLAKDWRTHLALAAATAVAAATIGGALTLGASVRASLRASALDGLGTTTHVLPIEASAPSNLADRLAAALGPGNTVAPLAVARGSVRASSGARAGRVDVLGVDARFLEMFALDAAGAPWRELLAANASRVTPPAVLDETLAAELGVAEGDRILVSLPRWSEVPAGSVLARRDSASRLRTLNARVVAIVADAGIARFSTNPGSATSATLLLPLAAVARALERDDRANTFAIATSAAGANLDSTLSRVLTLDDIGLSLQASEAGARLSSREVVLREALVAHAELVAKDQALATRRVVTGLANRVRVGDRSIGYATVTALGPLVNAPPSERLFSADATPLELPTAGGVLVEASTAARLGAAAWDELELELWRLDAADRLTEQTLELVVDGTTALAGIGADPNLSPELPGVSDAAAIRDWDPPFPFDLDRVEEADEVWWDERRATPKLFVSIEDAEKTWQSRWGSTTSLRFVGTVDLARLEGALLAGLPPTALGLVPVAVRADALERSNGSTDFAGLFIGFGIFLVGAALLLVALLFGLLVARRSPDLGLLLALGWPLGRVRRLLLGEAVVVAAVGAAVGALGAVGWARLMLWALRTRWSAAVGATPLQLHIEPLQLAIAAAATALLALATVRLSLRALAGPSPLALLRGAIVDRGGDHTSPWRGRVAVALAILAAGLTAVAVRRAGSSGAGEAALLAFTAGAAVLIAGMLAIGHLLRRPGGFAFAGSSRSSILARLAVGGARRTPRRASLLAGVVAASAFVLAVVAASTPPEVSVDHGAAGFELLVEAAIPFPDGLEEPETRADLGFSEDDEVLLQGVTIVPVRASSGDDASCLNLSRPVRPRVLGIPLAALEGRLLPTRTTLDGAAPLELLGRPGAVPLALGDADAVMWILRSGLGKEITVTSEGHTVQVAGLLDHSAFQGELLVAADRFPEPFPAVVGFGALLVDVPTGSDPVAVAALLESRLEEFGVDAVPTRSRLEAYRAVTATWLDTFRVLGGLGMLLGVLGVATLVLRTALERRREFDALLAFGWRRRSLAALLAVEQSAVVAAGITIALLAALVATVPARGATVLPAVVGSLPVLAGMVLLAVVVSAVAARGLAAER